MSIVAQWEENQLLEAAKPGLRKPKWLKALAVCCALVCCALPALAVSAANGYFDAPPVAVAQVGYAPTTMAPEPVLSRVAAPVMQPKPTKFTPRRVALAPRSCKTRSLELYGGQVWVCGRPATATVPRTTGDLVQKYRP